MLPRTIDSADKSKLELVNQANRNLLFTYAGRWAFVALAVLSGIKLGIGFEQEVYTPLILGLELLLVVVAALVAFFFRRSPALLMCLGLGVYALQIGVWASIDSKTFIQGFFLKAGVFGVVVYALLRLYSFRQNQQQLGVKAR